MTEFVIVGGGFAGLLAAHKLSKNGRDFIGLEANERLGGRSLVGHHRLYHPHSVETLGALFDNGTWRTVEEAPQERKKGEWHPAEGEYLPEETFLLGERFFQYGTPHAQLVEQWIEEFGPRFLTRRRVVRIQPGERVLTCDDGSRHEYRELVWCSDLNGLRKAWDGELPQLERALAKATAPAGGITLDLSLKAPLFSHRNTVIFPFRFKDKRLRALGTCESWGEAGREKHAAHWAVFLEEELLEDREEVAKCVRALKRELRKEFPDLDAQQISEKLTYFPRMGCEEPVSLESLRLGPHLHYLGAGARVGENPEGLKDLDQTVANFRLFAEFIEGASNQQPAES